ncbi:MAG: hypothetical protein GY773_08545, partial [Actinomycetia bacterium]|nr:hypothetical protein [Actinomycetes bacterium]
HQTPPLSQGATEAQPATGGELASFGGSGTTVSAPQALNRPEAVQSSSASTSVIVGLVASGTLGVDAAVPMVMGANIGTTVTNTLVSLGHVRQSNEFRRALAAATVHDFFNVMAVALLLPLELAFGIISSVAEAISEQLVGASGTDWKSPVKAWVKAPVGWLGDAWEAVGTR